MAFVLGSLFGFGDVKGLPFHKGKYTIKDKLFTLDVVSVDKGFSKLGGRA